MGKLEDYISEVLKELGVEAPPDGFQNRQAGELRFRSWDVKYVFGKDGRGEYFEFYATNKFMWGAHHLRIYESGEKKSFPSTRDVVFYSEDATEEQKKRTEEENAEYNHRVVNDLKKAGLW
jgi:hypothetical protein